MSARRKQKDIYLVNILYLDMTWNLKNNNNEMKDFDRIKAYTKQFYILFYESDSSEDSEEDESSPTCIMNWSVT